MKKFKFSLEVVLSYKRQMEDAVRAEHAAVLAKVREQEAVVDVLNQEYSDYNEEFRQAKMDGITIADAMFYQNGLRALEIDIQHETQKLEAVRKKEEEKREAVVEAKKEVSTLEKLREKKYESYQKAVEKDDEQFIEEFVSSQRVANNA